MTWIIVHNNRSTYPGNTRYANNVQAGVQFLVILVKMILYVI